MTVENHEFQAEVKKLLDLMVHSLYSNKDVFLRELISNASDALDRLRFESLTASQLMPEAELHISLIADPEARSLVVEDNGVGMSREDLVQNLGSPMTRAQVARPVLDGEALTRSRQRHHQRMVGPLALA